MKYNSILILILSILISVKYAKATLGTTAPCNNINDFQQGGCTTTNNEVCIGGACACNLEYVNDAGVCLRNCQPGYIREGENCKQCEQTSISKHAISRNSPWARGNPR